MTAVSRREFVGGALALGTCGAFGAPAPGAAPRLRFGVMSDVHIGGKPDAAETLEKTLRWFASEKVDAVLCAGDIAHSGLVKEIEGFAEVWHRVFPGNAKRGTVNGERVELMISTGNHDVDAWGGRWSKFTEEEMLAQRFNYRENPEKTWRRLFDQPWEVVWRREVKGYAFVGSQWSSLDPPVEAYMKENAATLDPAKPFFYCQHEHPNGTCHKYLAKGANRDEVVRALSAFPNAVAFSGHSHLAISDERAVWQGAFTSIGAGCIHEGSGGFGYDNISAFWHPSGRKNLMASMADPKPWGGDAKGGGCELVEVFDDRIVVHRQSVVFGRPIAPSWIVPIPARNGGPLDFGRRMSQRMASGAIPQFAAGAAISAKFCPKGHRLESAAHRGEPCIYVAFPRAQTVNGGRVYDYIVEASVDGGKPVSRKLVAAGFVYPEEFADIQGECLFSARELPVDKAIRFTVTPRDSFGLSGLPLVGELRI